VFRYLSRCTPRAPIILGDARLTLTKAPQQFVFTKRDDTANNFTVDHRANAHIAMLARNVADLGPLPQQGWVRAGATKVAPWTDDYSDIIGAILRKKMQR